MARSAANQDSAWEALTGAGQLWHGDQLLADVRYELSQSTDPEDPISIRGRAFGVPEEQIRTPYGLCCKCCFLSIVREW